MTLYKIKIKISKESLERFLKELIGFHPSIKFTFEKSKMKVNFLVVAVKTKNGRLSTDLYSKPVDSHQYPQYNSCQAEHIQTLLFTIKGEENLLKDKSSQVPCKGPYMVLEIFFDSCDFCDQTCSCF